MTQDAQFQSSQITSGGETFTRSTYNGFSVIIRDSDGYYNGTKMVADISTQTGQTKLFKNLLANNHFNEMCAELSRRLELAGIPASPKYELDAGHINGVKGTYVHPKLVNSIAEWSSVKYSFIVADIMDKMNEGAHAEGNTFLEHAQHYINSANRRIEILQAQNRRLGITQQALVEEKRRLVAEKRKLSTLIIRKGVIKENYKIVVQQCEDDKLYVQCLMQNCSQYKYKDAVVCVRSDIPCAKDILHHIRMQINEMYEPFKSDGARLVEGPCIFNMTLDQLLPILDNSINHYRTQFGERPVCRQVLPECEETL